MSLGKIKKSNHALHYISQFLNSQYLKLVNFLTVIHISLFEYNSIFFSYLSTAKIFQGEMAVPYELSSLTLHEKCPYSELFWSAFSPIWNEYGEILRISLYSVRMWENMDQNNSEYGLLLCSVIFVKKNHFSIQIHHNPICTDTFFWILWRIEINVGIFCFFIAVNLFVLSYYCRYLRIDLFIF